MKPARRLMKALPLAVALSGIAAAPALAAKPSVNPGGGFGSVAVGGSVSKTFTVTNNDSVESFSATITTGGSQFAITGTNCGAAVGIGGTCTVDVTFTPTSAGAKSGNLRVQGNLTNEFRNKALTGTGTAGGATLSPAAFDFDSFDTDPGPGVDPAGPTLIGSTTGPQQFTVSVQPFQTVTINGIDTNSSDFNITDTTCTQGAVLNSGNLMCTIDVVFNPASSGNKSGQLLVDTSSGTLASSLTGKGLGAVTSISPLSVNFGTVQPDLSGPNQVITFTNTGDPGSVNTIVSPLQLNQAAGQGFSLVSNTCTQGSSFFPGDSCEVVVKFTAPATTGAKSGSIKFTYTENGQNPILTQTVTLSGTSGPGDNPSDVSAHPPEPRRILGQPEPAGVPGLRHAWIRVPEHDDHEHGRRPAEPRQRLDRGERLQRQPLHDQLELVHDDAGRRRLLHRADQVQRHVEQHQGCHAVVQRWRHGRPAGFVASDQTGARPA